MYIFIKQETKTMLQSCIFIIIAVLLTFCSLKNPAKMKLPHKKILSIRYTNVFNIDSARSKVSVKSIMLQGIYI